jgi:hypothetical protein
VEQKTLQAQASAVSAVLDLPNHKQLELLIIYSKN